MENKIIIIGASLSGKTTLAKYLRSEKHLSVLEIDEELTKMNKGEYPKDDELKQNVLAPKVIKEILATSGPIIFFTNTNYLSNYHLEQARAKGFKIVQLELSLSDLQKRNSARVENEGYEDQSQWLAGMVEYQKKISALGLVDKIIDANQPVEKIAQELIQF